MIWKQYKLQEPSTVLNSVKSYIYSDRSVLAVIDCFEDIWISKIQLKELIEFNIYSSGYPMIKLKNFQVIESVGIQYGEFLFKLDGFQTTTSKVACVWFNDETISCAFPEQNEEIPNVQVQLIAPLEEIHNKWVYNRYLTKITETNG
jgi:hypothetical protein